MKKEKIKYENKITRNKTASCIRMYTQSTETGYLYPGFLDFDEFGGKDLKKLPFVALLSVFG